MKRSFSLWFFVCEFCFHFTVRFDLSHGRWSGFPFWTLWPPSWMSLFGCCVVLFSNTTQTKVRFKAKNPFHFQDPSFPVSGRTFGKIVLVSLDVLCLPKRLPPATRGRETHFTRVPKGSMTRIHRSSLDHSMGKASSPIKGVSCTHSSGFGCPINLAGEVPVGLGSPRPTGKGPSESQSLCQKP